MQISLNLLFLVRVLQVRPALAGLVTALGSLGGIMGGLLAVSISRRIGTARVLCFSHLIFGAPVFLLLFAEPGWRIVLFVVGYGASAFACAIFSASQVAYRQSICPPELRGRMNAASRWIIWGPLPVGGFLGGIIGSAIGLRPSIWIAYLGLWATDLLVVFSPLRRVRDVSDLAPDGTLAPGLDALTLIIHAGSWLPLTARSAVQMAGILLCGYDGFPAGGPVLRGSTGPGWISTGRRDRFAQVNRGRGGRRSAARPG